MNDKLLMSDPVVIEWYAQDLVNRYGFTPEKALDVFAEIAEALEDRSVEAGWEIIDHLVSGL